VPAPSHVRPSVWVVAPAGQAGGAHDVPAPKSWQAPAPSQNPVVPQLAAPAFAHVPVGSAPPPGTGAHVPAVAASAHDRHVPVQAVLQHTPCAHVPDAHSAPSAHAAPGDLRPHEPFVHTAGATQSASAVHVALHAEPPQRKGKHEDAVGVTHVPAPSHVEPGVNVVPGIVVGQLASAHGTPCAYFWQAPASHMPFVPQVDIVCAAHVPAGSGAPGGTSRQRPIEPVSAHERHGPEQSAAQHTPCAHAPETHSLLSEQNAPVGFLPHELLASHVLGATQAASAVHEPQQRAPLQA
jgi:hypothetical protein